MSQLGITHPVIALPTAARAAFLAQARGLPVRIYEGELPE